MLKHVMVCVVLLAGCGKKEQAAETGSAAAKPAAGSAAAPAGSAEAPAPTPAAAPPPRTSPATAEMLAKFDAACDAGHGTACFDAGMRRAQGMGTAKDRVAGASWLDKGCKLDDAESCALLAGFVATGQESVPMDKARAIELHTKACPRVATSCRMLAQYYGRGEIVKQDLAKAMSLLDQACTAGDQPACKQAADHRANGTDK
jgi:TPR repeat protein